ncbi:DNA/RNA non-specific endonuclease [Fibrella forsythiae]|uniref:Endonuclease n=1 Tax=Fibrella forsythiae TaxID=2817061 RepID=A0ABS3JDD6_9BACT|nr:DNA/RNA non-specific endonuclease [Fibrella forsythiae]MBO0948010.1 DNA/RNA non-specific endonuclease [Fibrella forsythiae]
MFFRPKFRTSQRYTRRGFRLRGNTLIILFGFFMVGLFLHYKGRTEPVVAFWNDVRSLLGIGRSTHERTGTNPYKAPEPTTDEASDDRSSGTDSAESEASDSQSGSSESTGTATRSSEQRTSGKLFDFEKQVDFILPSGHDDDELVRHDGYTLRYDTDLKNPLWVAYPLLAYEITGDADRDTERFVPDPAVDGGTALPSDYTKSGYDRGHQAPAGDFKFSQQLTRQSFFMSNISPQAPQFNRGIWKSLEEQVRAWAFRDGGLYVVTGPVLRKGLPTIGRANEVAVPDSFYKVILYCRKGASPDIRMIGFLLKNEPSDESLKAFVVPVSSIEQATGLDFFDKMPDDLERRLKMQSRSQMVSQWFD